MSIECSKCSLQTSKDILLGNRTSDKQNEKEMLKEIEEIQATVWSKRKLGPFCGRILSYPVSWAKLAAGAKS